MYDIWQIYIVIILIPMNLSTEHLNCQRSLKIFENDQNAYASYNNYILYCFG